MAYGDYDGPNRPDKGKEGGSCNRTRCQCAPARWWNHGSYSWYCDDCKRDIGDANKRHWEKDFGHLKHPMFETRQQMDERLNPTPAPNSIGWVTVRVEDTGDGLIINADDAKEWRLVADQHYEGHFLPDGKYRIAIPQRAAKDSPVSKVGPTAEAIARIIDPSNFAMTPKCYGTDEKGFEDTWAYAGQQVAMERARAIIKIFSTKEDADV